MSRLSSSPFAAAAIDKVRTRLRGVFPVEDLKRLPRQSAPWKDLRLAAAISGVLHAIVLLVLSWIIFDLPRPDLVGSVLSLILAEKSPLGDEVHVDLLEPAEVLPESEEEIATAEPAFQQPEFDSLSTGTVSGQALPVLPPQRPDKQTEAQPSTAMASATPVSKAPVKRAASTVPEEEHTDHFVGRNPATKAALLKRMGGTDASEAAVARGLIWLKNHQLPDGSWNFYHLLNPRCDCTMPGRLMNNPNGATAMALLAFLGAGQTHQAGDYQAEVQQGLEFLLSHGSGAEKGICYYGQLEGPPTFYTHGLVTIALSEAFAMTHDAKLRTAVTGAVDFLVATQEQGGGWRYYPGQPGDLSVVAWQLMALKSAQFSRISVPQKVFTGVDRFVKGAGAMRGTQYSYMIGRPPTPSMTAAGILCRMYLDWTDSNKSLRAAIHYLDQQGPAPDNMYYNYYATQVMHHWGGEEWDRWNTLMREHLIFTQVRDGHATGSWDVADPHGGMGGRLYMTTLALLTLEVYYRHLPLYQRDRIEIPLIHEAAANPKAADPKGK